MTLEKEKLESLKAHLLERKQQILVKLKQGPASLEEGDTSLGDAADQANADTDKSLELQMRNRERQFLFEIDHALRRIDAGTFGECTQCGESITEARLLAHPSTTLCIDCKAELEFDKTRFPGRD